MPLYKHILLPLCLSLIMTEILLLPFNGQLNLRNAYNWNRNQVSLPDMLFNLYQNGC